jgi:putative membrane-bound dehydrogenase-like protein
MGFISCNRTSIPKIANHENNELFTTDYLLQKSFLMQLICTTRLKSLLSKNISLTIFIFFFLFSQFIIAEEKMVHYQFKPAGKADEELIFTPPGFKKVGHPKKASGNNSAILKIIVNDSKTGEPTFCRINVVGSDGNYYEPAQNYFTQYGLTGKWPNWPMGWGNRQGKAPIRYFGRFFYSWGKSTIKVIPGKTRIEIWKGFEYQPVTHEINLEKGESVSVTLQLNHEIPMAEYGYHSGDSHIHISRNNPDDADKILDLMEAEDIHYGSILAYNEPAGPYSGFLDKMDTPQFQGIGKNSVRKRGSYSILSGQEYRSSSYGHLNLFFNDDIVMKGKNINADNWPPFGNVGRQTQKNGGFAFYAHGGYAKEIYADLVQGDINGVELLQFGVYRGIGLDDWYHILNCGFRFPMIGASDYPACRKLGDCKTFIHSTEKRPSFKNWMKANANGESFVTTGPMLLLTVNKKKPGHLFHPKKPESFEINFKVKSVVAPVTHLQIISNGIIVAEKVLPNPSQENSGWIQLKKKIKLSQSIWIAARAYSLSVNGTPDAESHTNPVYIYFNDKAPYSQKSLDAILEKLDGQMDGHRKRKFPEVSKILNYFQRSRDILLQIRANKGLPSSASPKHFAKPTIDTTSTHISEEDLKTLLAPLPPKEPEEALETFESVSNFTMQIVASEPLVHDPIAACFDKSGNLYVTEMLDYPYHPNENEKPIGRVRLLRDTNNDGRFDKSTVFAEELLWAGGVVPWKGGVYIAAPPNIWYMKDTNGDDKADIRRIVFSGFGDQNQQAMVNNLKFGLDHKIYGSTASNGGNIVSAEHPELKPIPLHGKDFCFDPHTEIFETVTGTVQFGNSFDDWGNRFMCNQGEPGRHEVLPQRYLKRNPYLIVRKAIQPVAPSGIQIYRTSPIEAWRQIRVARRRAKKPVSAASTGSTHHVIDGSAGTTVYRGNAYPQEFYGNIFIGCGQNNLVHRRKLIPDGVTFRSERIEKRNEFMRSTDIWFRPVNFINAPDGTLYCLDMSREFLESIHIPLDVVKHLNLTSGRDRGRIYRMAPPNFKYPGEPTNDSFTSGKLISHLQNKNGWWRDTAHRLIYENQDRSLIPQLKITALENPFPQARLLALWSLQGLNSLEPKDILKALSDSHPRIREHAVRLSEPFLDSNANILNQVIKLADHPDQRILFQVAFSLGESKSKLAINALAQMSINDSKGEFMRMAILSSVTNYPATLFETLWKNQEFSASSTGITFLKQLMQIVGSRNQQDEIITVLNSFARSNQQNSIISLFESLASAMVSTGNRPATLKNLPPESIKFLDQFLVQAINPASNGILKSEIRINAIRRIAFFPLNQTNNILQKLLDQPESGQLHLAVIQALGTYNNSEAGQLLLDRWNSFTPELRSSAINSLLANEESTLAFLQAAKNKQVSITSLTPTRQTILIKHRNPKIAQLSKELFSSLENTPRNQIAKKYQKSLSLKGESKSGENIFKKNCSACHQVGKTGKEIGPNLMTTLDKDSSMFITHIMDPNRYVPPNYIQYIIVDLNGKIWTGMISEQTATSITLKEDKDKTHTILLNQIDEMTSTGKSLMPEGLEKELTLQNMSDLIAFLNKHKKQLDQVSKLKLKEKQKEIGTEPGLLVPKK